MMRPDTGRVAFLLARVSLRRWFNRIVSRRRRKPTAKRAGTARKGGRSALLLVLFGLLFLFNSVNISTRFVGRLANEVEASGRDEGAKVERLRHVFPGPEIWADSEEGAREVVAGTGTLLALLLGALFFMALSAGNVELGQVGWSMEWLFTFPVTTRALFAARIGEYALTNFFSWLTVFPLLLALYAGAGYGIASLPLALLLGFCANLLLASGRLLVETALRKKLSLRGLKDVQAVCTVIGILLFFLAMGLALFDVFGNVLPRIAHHLPTWTLLQPLSAAALVALDWRYLLPALLFVPIVVTLCLRGAGALVRGGLLTVSGGPYRGTRKPAGSGMTGRRRGFLGKEMLLLGRDKNFAVQTLVVPLLLMGFWTMTASHDMIGKLHGGGEAAAAFVVGAYVLMFGGFSVLATETRALWLLYTFPQSLGRMLFAKVRLWAWVAAAYALGALFLLWRPDGALPSSLLAAALVVSGMPLFAVLAGGIGTLGTDPFALEARRRIRPEWAYLYLLLIAAYGHAVASGSLWTKFAIVFLVAFLAYAIWELVRDRLPLLLDPTGKPPPRVTLAGGLVAALLLLETQQVVGFLLAQGDVWTPGMRLVAAYAAGGLLAVLASLYMLRGMGLRAVARRLGLGGGPLLRNLFWGAGLGGVAGLCGLAYLKVVHPEGGLPEAGAELRWGMAVVAIGLAPFFEEFVFRGILFRALQRHLPAARAILLSAAVFAVVHPAVSFPPVFVLGLVAAFGYARRGKLLTPVVVHMVYNAIVILLGR